jgi:hypothetical protein
MQQANERLKKAKEQANETVQKAKDDEADKWLTKAADLALLVDAAQSSKAKLEQDLDEAVSRGDQLEKSLDEANQMVKSLRTQVDESLPMKELQIEALLWRVGNLEQIQDETRSQVASYLYHTSPWTVSLGQSTDQSFDLWLELAGLAMEAPVVIRPMPELRYWRIDDAWGFSNEIGPRQNTGGLMVELFGSVKSGHWVRGSAQEALRNLTKDVVTFEELNFTVVIGFINTFLSVAKAKQMVSTCEALTFCIGMYQLIALVKKREANKREYSDATLNDVLCKVVGSRFLYGLEDGDIASLRPGQYSKDAAVGTPVIVHGDDVFVRSERVMIKIDLQNRSLRVLSRDRAARPRSGRMVIRAPPNQRDLMVRIGKDLKAIDWWTQTASWRGTQTQVYGFESETEEV